MLADIVPCVYMQLLNVHMTLFLCAILLDYILYEIP